MASKYLSFLEIELTPKKKTKIFAVKNKIYGDLLGYVKWYAPWRKYCFFANNTDLIFDSGCLTDISDFIENEMQKHRDVNKLNSLRPGLDIESIEGV